MSAAELVARTRKAQGLSPRVTDAGVLARVVALLMKGGRREK